MLASVLYPYDDDAPSLIEGWLSELEREACIVRYKVEGSSFMQIAKWLSHQKIDKPTRSKFPEFDESSRILANPRDEVGKSIESSPLERKGEEGRGYGGDQEGKGSAEPRGDSTPSAPPEPAVVSIPLIDKSEFGVTQSQLDEWAHSFPAVDVLQQLREMRQWCMANPTKKKTRRGVLAFVTRWLGSEQDRGGSPVAGRPQFFNRQAAIEENNRTVANGWMPPEMRGYQAAGSAQ